MPAINSRSNAAIQLEVASDSGDDRAALEQALLRARATELAEVRRLEAG